MPWNRPSLTKLHERVARDFSAHLLDGGTLLQQSVLGALAKVWAGSCHTMHAFFAWAFPQMHPDTAEGEFLQRWAAIWGVKAKDAAHASGPVPLRGLSGTLVPAGTLLLHPPTGQQYALLEDVLLTDGTGAGTVRAVEPGGAGCLVPGSALQLVSPLAGVHSQVVLGGEGIAGGADAETDDSLRTRLLSVLREPPHGGNAADYVQWALEVPGVTRAWCHPHVFGLGSVGVTILADDAPDGPLPDAELVARVQTHLDATRPVAAFVSVFAPEVLPVTVRLRVTPDTALVREAVLRELRDLWRREAGDGATVYRSHISEAVSMAEGEADHTLLDPAGDIVADRGVYPALAGVEWV